MRWGGGRSLPPGECSHHLLGMPGTLGLADHLPSLPAPDHQKLCYSALILAMVFSMGEAVPYAHYGKHADC